MGGIAKRRIEQYTFPSHNLSAAAATVRILESNISKLFKWSFRVRNQNRDSLDSPTNKRSKSYSSYIAQS